MAPGPEGSCEGEAGGGGLIVNVWSGPRSLSTSLLYAFAQRSDTEVVDEPLYAHYLRTTGAQRPYRDLVLASQDADGERVVHSVIHAPLSKKVRYVKHMAKQLTPDLPPELTSRGAHVLLIRDPLEVLPSFASVVPASLDELALPHLLQLYSDLRRAGRPPPVVDATALRRNPEGILRALCAQLGLPFDPAMLSWQPGGRPEDGVWSPWWYGAVHASSGFAPPTLPRKAFPLELYALLEEARPFYAALQRHALPPLGTAQLAAPAAEPALPEPRNTQLLVWVGGQLLPRCDARVSVLDSAVQGGDAVWEGLRVYSGRVLSLEEHLDRLKDSAKAMAFTHVPSANEVKEALAATLAANGMRDGAHVRLTLTRGKKVTSGMSPQFNQYGSTLIVLAEWKPPGCANDTGIRLVTAATRRNCPQCLDSKIHHCNLINNILAKVEGNTAGVEDALMLDVDGFVAETNATNVFMVKRGRLLTPLAEHCLPGITRSNVLQLAQHEGIPVRERRLSLAEFHGADEMFTTGTMGELSPVVELDGRTIGAGTVGPITRCLQAAYRQLTETHGWPLPF